MHAGKTHEKHQKSQASGPTQPEVQRRTSTISSNNLTRKNWFHSLPTCRFHALLTLFSKSFSPFHHCTCLLSVSDLYLALGDNYLPFCAPIPKYATLRQCSVRARLSVKDGNFTLSVASFQWNLHRRLRWRHTFRLQFATKVEIYKLSSPLFIRHYWGDHIHFLFLHLLICLN